jgi:hypothetical protein
MPAPIGNQNAIKAKRWQKALERALARLGAGDVDMGLNGIADRVVSLAQAGDKDAWKEIGDRLDGKPAQSVSIDLTQRTIVDLADTDLAGIVEADSSGGAVSPQDGPQGPAGLH